MSMSSTTPKKNFVIFSENDTIFEKIGIWRTVWNFISHKKKGYIHFRHQTPLPFKRFGPQKQFFAIFSENTIFFFWEKLLNNKIFST